MAHISQKRRFHPVGLFCLNPGSYKLLFRLLDFGYIPRYSDNIRMLTSRRDNCFHCSDRTDLTAHSCIILQIFNTSQLHHLQIVFPEMFGIFLVREYICIRTTDSPLDRDSGMLGKSFIPIKITKIISGILHK